MSPASGVRRPRHVAPSMVVWLTAVWIALWGTLSVANVLSGVLVALFVLLALPLPPGRVRLGLHPIGFVRFVIRFAVDLVVASARVAWQATRPGPPPRSSVIAVQLQTRSDVLLTATVVALSVLPGSIVVEIRHRTGTLFVHALGAATPREVTGVRADIAALEGRVVRAFGTRADLRAFARREKEGNP